MKFISDMTVRLIQQMGGDHMVIAAAKVSISGEEALKFAQAEANEGNYGLIKYLMTHRHGTPFEHSALTFFVHAPIFTWREIHRHRIGISFNEESARYKKLEPVFWVPRPERPMAPAEGYKPARPKFEAIDKTKYDKLIDRMKTSYELAYKMYEESIADGVSNEVSRAVLPVGIYSSCWVTVNPRSLMHFLSLRTHEPAATFVSYPQAEIEEVARMMEQMFQKGWPLCYRAFTECGRVAP